jgi:lysophospholipase L1-like esterase
VRARPTHRIRSLVLAALAAVGLVVGGASPALAAPSGSGGAHGGTYLALGDSVAFGYRANAGTAYRNAANFAGYPERVARDRGLRLVNASCPGETTDSFIDATAPSNGCENLYRAQFPLHVAYRGSQLAFAVATLKARPNTRLVSIDLGANDAFLCQQPRHPAYCSGATDVAHIAAHVRQNLSRILTTLRTQAHYRGRIVVLDYYALDYSDRAATQSTRALDSAIDAAAVGTRSRVASGFTAFRPRALRAGGSSTAAGLVLPHDIHPTALGHRLLANAVERSAA